MLCANKPKHSTDFFSFIDQSYSFNLRHREVDIVCADYFKVIIFWKKTIREKLKFYEFLVCGIKKLIRDSRTTKLKLLLCN